VLAEDAVTLTDRERRTLQRIELELMTEAPRLERFLRAPGPWIRLRWGPRRNRLALLSITVVVLCSALAVTLAFTLPH
jgi:hypothetical protein